MRWDIHCKICSSGHSPLFRKDLCEAKHEMQSVLKFSDVLFALKSDAPPVVEVSGQIDISVRCVGQADLWSDINLSRGIKWPSLELCQVRPIFGQTYPPVEASSGQEWYYFRSG